jgi:heptaprenyl diphosphate synthase
VAGGSAVSDDVVHGGVAVELVHLGSLYHDDVIDEAPTRRTVESVNARWGNLTAILAGDFLLARASEIAASLGTEVAGLLAATIGRLCEGEVGELKTAYNVDRTEVAYFAAIEGKTAALFATACRIGALVGSLPRPQVDALTEFGLGYGMAFQIVDDVLDVTATEAELGKPVGHDLVEGVYTLPVLRALAASDSELRSKVPSSTTHCRWCGPMVRCPAQWPPRTTTQQRPSPRSSRSATTMARSGCAAPSISCSRASPSERRERARGIRKRGG